MLNQEWISIFQSKICDLNKGHRWWIEFDNSIEVDQQAAGWQQYIRKAFAWFSCTMCRNTWASAQVPVVFHMQLNQAQGQGTVKVRWYKQKCRKCQNANFEEPQIKRDNVEVLLDKLMEKILSKCYNENTGEKNRSFYVEGEREGPHEKAHCEACFKGICQRTT
ncbi:receptor-transporting protein 4-like [Lepisosteus oculatus]|uniref:Receptor-transporting protein 4-like n=1 Tax=Lepisosteus oculatus TaxID=7918 RepID=W5MPV6_LEPOC|nr:PREDICTED: receptor-transporting protein 4-like [Lepisosteus oculatus]